MPHFQWRANIVSNSTAGERPVTLSALVDRLRRDRPNATDFEVRAELIERIKRGLADDDPAYVDLLHNLVMDRLLVDGD